MLYDDLYCFLGDIVRLADEIIHLHATGCCRSRGLQADLTSFAYRLHDMLYTGHAPDLQLHWQCLSLEH